VYERDQHFLQNDPDLQVIVNDFTPEMFTVLGTPLGGHVYVRDFVVQNCTRITKLVDGHMMVILSGFIKFIMNR
jgi:hypothetical protein